MDELAATQVLLWVFALDGVKLLVGRRVSTGHEVAPPVIPATTIGRNTTMDGEA